MVKVENGLKVTSCFLLDSSGNEIPVVALTAIDPSETLRLDEPWQKEIARELEWHYRPPYSTVDPEGDE